MWKVAAFVILAALCAAGYAGDVANFVEIGFSPGGRTFAFGQHGTDDKTLFAYADIFFVDVAKNVFVPGANVSLPPGASPGVESPVVFSRLKKSADLSMRRLLIDSTGGNTGRAIYTEDAAAPPNDGLAMSFRDFETEKSYDVALHQEASGSGAGASSSFYITAKITDAEGKTENVTVGNPGYKRRGVLGYRISRILTDASNRALVFVVEKEMYSPRGNSVRYMVETVYL